MVIDLLRQHDLPRNKRRAGIKLFYKCSQYLFLSIFISDLYIKVIPSDQFSIPDKKYLYDRIPVVCGKCNNILVLAVIVRDLLFLCDLFHTV